MKYSDKHQLTKSIIGFLKQRRRVYQVVKKDPHKVMVIGCMINDFELIRGYNYWALCRKVKAFEEKLLQILPSSHGKHNRERIHMMELIAHCKNIASLTRHQYENLVRNKVSVDPQT